MPNRNYINGRRKEYAIIKELKERGFNIAQRTAGSHSPIDVFGISKDKKVITFIQSKPTNFSARKKEEILKELDYLNDNFKVEFKLV